MKYTSHFFVNGKETTEIVIPNTVDNIPPYAFNAFKSVSSVVISNSVKAIGRKAFEKASLLNLTLGNSLKTIGEDAFSNCQMLGTVVIPNSVVSIGENAFFGCDNMKKLILGSGVTTIGNEAFRYCNFGTLIIPDNVISIGEYAFYSCDVLANLKIGKGVKNLKKGTFGDTYLNSLIIPDNVTTIDDAINTKYLKSVSIGRNVVYVNLFNSNLTDVYCHVSDVSQVKTVYFGNPAIATLHVPGNSIEAYKNKSPWNKFGKIVALTDNDPDDGNEPVDEVVLIGKDYTRVYGEPNPEFDYYVAKGTILSGKPELSCDATAKSKVGTYRIYLKTGTISNSSVTRIQGTLTITKAPLKATVGEYTKMEGEDNPTFKMTCSGFKNGDTKPGLVGNYTTEATNFSRAGNYPVYAEFKSNTESNYYVEGNLKGSLTIIPRSEMKDGDPFLDKTKEGFDMMFKVISEKDKTCQVGNNRALNDYVTQTIKTITIPEKARGYRVIKIQNGAFSKAEQLERISVPNTLEEIGHSSFYGCKKLQSFIIPETVKTISENAFYGCKHLANINLPNSLVDLGKSAFYDCKSLTSIKIPDSIITLKDNTFYGCNSLKSLIIGNSVTSIETRVFSNCSSLSSVTIPNSVTTIGYGAFSSCSSLTSLTIPNSVTTIGYDAFSYCSGLTSVTIPGSVTSIRSYAFRSCSGMKEVRSKIKVPFAIESSVFPNYNIPLYVPRGTKAQYESTNGWKNFTNIIETDFNDKPQGDLTGDEIVNGTDMVALVNVIMNGGNNPSADVNNDGQVNGTDMVALVNIIMKNDNARELMALGGEGETPAAARSEDERISFANSGVTIGAEPIRTNGDGSLELTITMTNPQMDVTMVQMDVTLPEGLTLPIDDSTDMMAGRTSWQTHQIYSAASDDGRNVRLMLASGRNALIEGTEGGIIRLTLKADDTFTGGDIVLHDMLCTSPDLQEARPADVVVCADEATGISDVSRLNNNEQRTIDKPVYNLNGQRINTQRKGVNIVNGRKVIR